MSFCAEKRMENSRVPEVDLGTSDLPLADVLEPRL